MEGKTVQQVIAELDAAKKKEGEEERNELLISLDLYDVVIDKSAGSSDREDIVYGFQYKDEETGKYYRGKKIAKQITDEEYAEILKRVGEKETTLKFAEENTLKTWGGICIAIGIIALVASIIVAAVGGGGGVLIYGLLAFFVEIVTGCACRAFSKMGINIAKIAKKLGCTIEETQSAKI